MPFERPREHVALAPLSTLGIGGAARWFARATTVEEIATGQGWQSAPLLVLGGGSNLVIADEGFDGLVLKIGIAGVTTVASGADVIVTAGAGEGWDALVEFTVDRGFAGIECLSGIPGTVGGTPVQNVGAYGQDVGEVIAWVDAFDRELQATVRLSSSDCGFAYRTSRFKERDAGRFIISEVAFRLRPGGPPTVTYPDIVDALSRRGVDSPDLRDVRNAVLGVRTRKGMVIDAADPDTRSIGSFFTNAVVSRGTLDRIPQAPHYVMQNDRVKIPAAWLIEQSGFARGHVDGQVGLSTKHPLAIINRGGATARDVVRFACRIKRAVADHFGIILRPEPVFVGFAGDPDVDYLRG